MPPLFLEFALYSFLLVVVLAAVICLLGIAGTIRVPPYYEKKLFASVVLAIVSLVVLLVRQAVLPPRIAVSEDVFLSSKGSWDWSYPEKSWRTYVSFKKDKSGLTFSATTYLYRGQGGIPVVKWNSIKPIKLAGTENSVAFDVTRQWTTEAAAAYPELQYEIGKQFSGIMTISADVALRGIWQPTDATSPWDLVLNQHGR